MNEKGYSENKLALKSGLTQSTINSMFRKNSLPSLPTLIKLCDALDITMSQFFQDDADNQSHLSEKQQELLYEWNLLSPENQNIILDMIHFFKTRN